MSIPPVFFLWYYLDCTARLLCMLDTLLPANVDPYWRRTTESIRGTSANERSVATELWMDPRLGLWVRSRQLRADHKNGLCGESYITAGRKQTIVITVGLSVGEHISENSWVQSGSVAVHYMHFWFYGWRHLFLQTVYRRQCSSVYVQS